MPRRAVLIFADEAHIDLARRAFPATLRPLLQLPALRAELTSRCDFHLFTSDRSAAPQGGLKVHRQAGDDFAARLENAIATIDHLGYEQIVIIGRDCPNLCAADIERAFVELESRKLVLGPDHRGGCYLIAFGMTNRALLRGVRWRQDTDCAELHQRCRSAEVFLLPVKHDIDSWADVRIFARGDSALARLASFFLGFYCDLRQSSVPFVSRALQRVRVRQQMPPPALAS